MIKDFAIKYGEGFHTFNVPLDNESKRHLVGLLADRSPSELDEDEIESRYSLRVHFLEKADSVIAYCGGSRWVVFVVWADEFRVLTESMRDCLRCSKEGGYEIEGTEAQASMEGNYRKNVVFCKECISELTDCVNEKKFVASVVSNKI